MNITLKGTVGGQVTFNCQTYGRIPIPKVQRSLSRDCLTGNLVVTQFYNKIPSLSPTGSLNPSMTILSTFLLPTTLLLIPMMTIPKNQ